eukprot:1896183-Prymnesium_polylepis.1
MVGPDEVCMMVTGWGSRERTTKLLEYMCSWMLMTTIWHNIHSPRDSKPMFYFDCLMGDFVCSNGRGD